ncbi:MAG: porin family protein [Bacteroidota bacterium]
MKKYVVLLTYLLSTTGLYAQGRLGMQISPAISFGRVHTEPNNSNFSSPGAKLRFRLGAIYDYTFQDNYNLSTGLFYATHQFSIKKETQPQIEEAHELHYLQVPLLLKFYTSEITLDARIYAKLGITGQIKLTSRNTELKDGVEVFIDDFRRWGLTGLVGAGVEYDTSFSTSIFAGISYQPGFVNIIGTKRQSTFSSQVLGYADLINIDLGARF